MPGPIPGYLHLERYKKFFIDGVFDIKTKQMKCTRCGGCCSLEHPLTKNEILWIHRFIEEMGIEDQDNYGDTCPFLDTSDMRCTIEPIKPLICKLYFCDFYGKGIPSYVLLKEERKRINMKEEFFSGKEWKHDLGVRRRII